MRRKSILLAALFLLANAPASDGIGRIKSSLGLATIERGSEQINAQAGTDLLAGDWLVTGADGKMGLTFVDNTRFSIGPDSRIALKQFEYDPTTQKGTFIAKVERGSIAIVSGRITKNTRDGMQVETPDSVIGVNGTRFIIVVPK